MNKKFSRRSNEELDKIRENIGKYLDSIFGDNLDKLESSNVPSLGEISREFNIEIKSLRNYLQEKYLPNKCNTFQKASDIYKSLWPAPFSDSSQRKSNLYKLLDDQMVFYPDNIEKIDGLFELAKKIGSHAITLFKNDEKTGRKTGWIIDYLIDHFGSENLAEKIYTEIWSIRSDKNNPYTYDDIVDFIENRGGRVITTRVQWESSKEQPKYREIEIQCDIEEHDSWTTNLRNLLRNNWCPFCRESFCQMMLGMYMKEIFSYLANNPMKIESKKYLRDAYGIPWDLDGRLQYDKYISSVEIKGKMKGKGSYIKKTVSVCGEYDGIQHNKFPNQYFHDEKERPRWNRLRQNDKRKDELSLDKGTYIIRLKAKWNYDANTIGTFQEEIIRQLQDWTGLKFDPMPKWIYNKWTNELEKDPTGTLIDVPLDPNAPCKPKLNKGPMDKFLG